MTNDFTRVFKHLSFISNYILLDFVEETYFFLIKNILQQKREPFISIKHKNTISNNAEA